MLTKNDLFELQKKSAVVVQEVGSYILTEWPKISKITYKDSRDVVTNVDVEAEALLREKLHSLFPEAGFIVEEGKTQKKEVYNWTIDPIDGTKYYATSTPLFLSQIALLENGVPVLGHICNPTVNHLFSASRENGAYFNGEKITLEKPRLPEEAIVEIMLGERSEELNWKMKILTTIEKNVYRFRSIGSAYYVYILKGAFDAIINLRQDDKDADGTPDSAPGDILHTEAGLIIRKEIVDGKRIKMTGHKSLVDFLYNKIKSYE